MATTQVAESQAGRDEGLGPRPGAAEGAGSLGLCRGPAGRCCPSVRTVGLVGRLQCLRVVHTGQSRGVTSGEVGGRARSAERESGRTFDKAPGSVLSPGSAPACAGLGPVGCSWACQASGSPGHSEGQVWVG